MTDVPDASPPTGRPDPPTPTFDGRELEVDLSAFLPEGTSLAEVPPQAATDEPEGVAENSSPPARPAVVDVAVLTRIEGELAAVDDALLAIDAGDPHRSALLVELLGEAEAASGRSPVGDGTAPS